MATEIRGSIPAIVLSHERTVPIVEHMIGRYQELWPEHPFVFRVPDSNSARGLADKFPDVVELVPIEDSRIRGTVLGLIDGLDEDQWVYWCIDDKYPVSINRRTMNAIARDVVEIRDPGVSAVCAVRPLAVTWQGQSAIGEFLIGRCRFRQRTDWRGIWLHQFVRVRLLTHFFAAMPDDIPAARWLDEWKKDQPLPLHQTLWMIKKSKMILGESTTAGKITRNCDDSMKKRGLDASRYELDRKRRIVGEGMLKWRTRGLIERD